MKGPGPFHFDNSDKSGFMYSIRPLSSTDIPLLRDLVFRVWPQTYEAILSKGQVDYMLDMMYSESSLLKQMEEGAQFIFVYEGNEAVGFASYQEIEPALFKLHKLYVLPSQQGKGTGRYMIDYIIGQIKSRGANALQLQVNRGNKARYFYEKLGFSIIRSFDFDIGNGYVMDDYVMEKKL